MKFYIYLYILSIFIYSIVPIDIAINIAASKNYFKLGTLKMMAMSSLISAKIKFLSMVGTDKVIFLLVQQV